MRAPPGRPGRDGIRRCGLRGSVSAPSVSGEDCAGSCRGIRLCRFVVDRAVRARLVLATIVRVKFIR